MSKKPVEIVAHRGANTFAPENTWASSALALEHGADYIEIDVRESVDGVLYIIHDSTVDRTTDGSGNIADMHSSDLDGLDAGSWFGAGYTGQRLPRFEPWLHWLKANRAKSYIEIKHCDVVKLHELISNLGLAQSVFFFSFDQELQQQLAAINPSLRQMVPLKYVQDLDDAKQRFNASIIECDLNELSEELVSEIHARNMQLMVIHQPMSANDTAVQNPYYHSCLAVPRPSRPHR